MIILSSVVFLPTLWPTWFKETETYILFCLLTWSLNCPYAFRFVLMWPCLPFIVSSLLVSTLSFELYYTNGMFHCHFYSSLFYFWSEMMVNIRGGTLSGNVLISESESQSFGPSPFLQSKETWANEWTPSIALLTARKVHMPNPERFFRVKWVNYEDFSRTYNLIF